MPRRVMIWKIVRSPAEPRNIGFCSNEIERSIYSIKPRWQSADYATRRTCSTAMSVVVLEKPHHVSSPPFT